MGFHRVVSVEAISPEGRFRRASSPFCSPERLAAGSLADNHELGRVRDARVVAAVEAHVERVAHVTERPTPEARQLAQPAPASLPRQDAPFRAPQRGEIPLGQHEALILGENATDVC
jgi:hypothetical protein